jgi:tetratricopeptide (TPR) repeat protein
MISVLCCIITGAIFRNIPVRKYIAGYREYKRGISLSHDGKKQYAAKHFAKAIKIMDPLLSNRARYDHRDIINSLLFTAMCHEEMGELDKAEAWYRTLLREYPYSRYVAEGYVKIARIYKQKKELIWQDGLDKLREGNHAMGTQLLLDGLSFTEKGIEYYQKALENDAYSIWSDHAQKDLKNEKRNLDRLKGDLQLSKQNNEVKRNDSGQNQ